MTHAPLNKLKQMLAYEENRLKVQRGSMFATARHIERLQEQRRDQLGLILQTRRDILQIERQIKNHPENEKDT